MKPQRIPWVIENVSGIKMIVKNAGSPSSILENEILPTLPNIEAPTRISTDAVANVGTIPASGARKRERDHQAHEAEDGGFDSRQSRANYICLLCEASPSQTLSERQHKEHAGKETQDQ